MMSREEEYADSLLKRRKYVRINDFIHLKYEIVEATKKDEALLKLKSLRASSAMRDNPQQVRLALYAKERDDPTLILVSQILERFEAKLDRIISMLSKPKNGDSGPMTIMAVDISGNGLRFPCAECFEPGQLLLIEFMLSTNVWKPIHVLGRIVRRELSPDDDPLSYRMSITYEDITESDREMIVRHVFHIQRERLRASKIVDPKTE